MVLTIFLNLKYQIKFEINTATFNSGHDKNAEFDYPYL